MKTIKKISGSFQLVSTSILHAPLHGKNSKSRRLKDGKNIVYAMRNFTAPRGTRLDKETCHYFHFLPVTAQRAFGVKMTSYQR